MNLRVYVIPLLKYWWLIGAAAVLAMASSYFVTSRQAPIYQTQTTLMVGRSLFETNPSSNDMWLGQQLTNYYADIGMRGDVRAATQEVLGLAWLPQYTINPLPNSLLMEIVVVDSSPERAQAVANELANQLMQRSPTSNQQQGSERQAFIDEQVNYLETKIRETLTEIDAAEKALSEMNSARQIADAQAEIGALQVKLAQLQTNYAALLSNTAQGALNTLSVIERAPLPLAPIGPNKTLIMAMSALVAIAIAAGAAYLLEYLDDTIKNPEDANQVLPVPVLANIPMMARTSTAPGDTSQTKFQALGQKIGKRLPTMQRHPTENGNGDADDKVYIYASNYPRSTVAEEFRSLRINLEFASIDKPIKSLLITSPSPGEGKTSVATNLAIVIAQAGKKVILVDADFRKPSIDTHFDIPNVKGLSDIFRDNLDLYDVAQHWENQLLWLVTTGIAPPNPVDLLSSQRMDQILEQFIKISDLVIIDGPPLLFPDSLALSTKVDGVLMILRHSFTRRGSAQQSYKKLNQVGARIIGTALNKTPGQTANYYSHYYYNRYYTDENEGKKVKAKTLN